MMAHDQSRIRILIATYNGEKYLATQLESILQQTYTNWQITIRDDHSTDNTPAIIEQYHRQYPDKISVLKPDDNSNKGSVLNFSALLSSARQDSYTMFCDQDDKWQPDKIELTLRKMHELEEIHGTTKPLLVFTDFLYVDETLHPIASKKDFHVTKLKEVRLAHLFAQNHVYGCTMMMNQPLVIIADPIPAEAENHDYWVAIVAASFGTIHYINRRTILYRQHSRNVSGNFNNNSFIKRFQRNVLQRRNVKDMIAKYAMLMVFRDRYASSLSYTEKETVTDFLNFYHHRNIRTLVKNIKNGVRSQTFIQSLLIYTTILFLNKKSFQAYHRSVLLSTDC